MDSNHRSSDYEPDELTGLLYRAKINWWRWQESNLRHSACKADVLPIELHPLKIWMRRMDLNHRSSDYEPDELTGLLYRAKINNLKNSKLKHLRLFRTSVLNKVNYF
jgi:hypothetical protein